MKDKTNIPKEELKYYVIGTIAIGKHKFTVVATDPENAQAAFLETCQSAFEDFKGVKIVPVHE